MARRDCREGAADPSEAGQATDLLRAGVEALCFGLAIFDRDLKLVTSNRAFGDLRGYPRALRRPGTSLAALFRLNATRGDYGPGDVEAQVATRLARARSRRARELEYELATGRILSIRYAPIALGGLLISYADVTEHRRAEQALRESEERYALAMAGANEGMWDWRAGSDEIFVSDSYKRLIRLELPSHSITLDQWVALIHPDDLAAHDAARRAHFDGTADIYECEYRVRCGNGEHRWFLDRATSIRDQDGAIYRMVGSMSDVTARKQAELDLLEADRRLNEQNQKLETLSAHLSKYLSPQLYASIFSGRQPVEISSRRKNLTIFFSDIRDFTGMTESLEPEELTGLLNHYLTEMTKIALDHGATIDKYVGDAIMAFFGDPETKGVKADAIACVEMAIAMQRRLRELELEWRDMGLEKPLQLRIGINTGFCTVGNFGSEARMEYTIIGNEVNLAARLQFHAQPGDILLAHKTYSLVKDRVLTEEQDAIAAKGFAKPVRTHKVVGIHDDLAAEGRIIRKERDGLRLLVDLTKRDKAAAIEAIEEFLAELRG